jgi:rRNA processing protein Gar1
VGANAVAQAAATTPATAADVKKGASVYDKNGDLVGTIDSVTGQSAVVSTGKVKATVEMSGFGKNEKGLVILMTKAEIEAAAEAAKPK